MINDNLAFRAQYADFKLGCERALDLLQDPDASEFDADKVIDFLRIVLGERGHE